MDSSRMQSIGLILLMGLGFLLVLQMNEKELEENEQPPKKQEEVAVEEIEEGSNTLSIVDTMINDTLMVTIGGESLGFHNADSLIGEDLSNWKNSIIDSLVADYQASSVTEMTSSEDVVQEQEEVVFEESFAVIENDVLRVTISSQGGQIASVVLKNYKNHLGKPVEITNDKSRFRFLIDTKTLGEFASNNAPFELTIGEDSLSISARAIMPSEANNGGFTMRYHLSPEGYMMQHEVVFDNGDNELFATDNLRMDWQQVMLSQEKDITEERRRSWLLYKGQGEDMALVKDGKTEEAENSYDWLSAKQQFFNVTLRGSQGTSFKDGKLSLDVPDADESIVKVATYENIQLDFARGNDSVTYHFEWIFAPNDYSLMLGYGQEMERITRPKFWVANWMFSFIMDRLLTPLFAWLEGMNLGYGLIILIMTILIKMALSPLTFRSYKSQAKMRVLKPEMDAIKEKYEGDQAKISQATMNLYRRTGVNPMSGCLPMVVQMPFLLAMFYFFPSAIELRGESFLWANDLSTYDDLIQFPFTILGSSHLSLFTLLFSLSSLGTAWVNLKTQGNNMQAGMEFMKYLPFIFPIVMLFIFNSFPAGLTYYYFLSTTFTLVQQLVIKQFFVDEDKIRTQLAAKKAKPQKKGGFWDRLQEAQKKQMEEMEKKNKKGKKK
ncbi:MAG: membrane protein insertase YidC [Chitinophagales bacterium]